MKICLIKTIRIYLKFANDDDLNFENFQNK